jgi:hypothetical protein
MADRFEAAQRVAVPGGFVIGIEQIVAEAARERRCTADLL